MRSQERQLSDSGASKVRPEEACAIADCSANRHSRDDGCVAKRAPGMNRQVPQLPVCNLISVEDNQQRTWPVIVENIRRFRLCFRPIHDIFRDLLQRPSNIAEVEAVAIQNGGEFPSNVSRNAVTNSSVCGLMLLKMDNFASVHPIIVFRCAPGRAHHALICGEDNSVCASHTDENCHTVKLILALGQMHNAPIVKPRKLSSRQVSDGSRFCCRQVS